MVNERHKPLDRYDQYLTWFLTFAVLAMIAYHLLIVWYPLFGEIMNQNTHLGFCFSVIFISWAKTAAAGWKKILYLSLMLLGLALVIYMAANYERLDMEAGFPEPTDVLVGVLLISIVIFQTWKSFGAIFPVLVLVALAYAFWGHLIPGVLSHPRFEFGYIISNLSVGFQGIYGMLLNVSVNMLFLLILFGSIFEATGVTRFFMEFGKLIGKHLLGGAGHTATFSSSFVGMVNGVAAANVAITGSYTIPMMKKAGFEAETAGAIEAMASTGGQLTPPIMGIAVFIMASFLGVSYTELMFKALIPALTYYAIAVLGVILIALREKISKREEIADKKILASGAPLFLIPMGVLTAVLLLHYSTGYAAFWGIFSLLAVSSLRGATRPKLRALMQNLISGTVMAATFGVAVACIGMLVKSLTFTGAATKLSLVVGSISGGYLLPTLILTAVLSIILSSSTPTVIAYIVVAFVAAPILEDLGLSKLVSHFFVFYYAILAAVTPPIAGGAIVGSQIAGASYMRTSWESFKLVGPFYLVPFFAVKNPIIFSQSQALVPAALVLCALVIAVGAMACFCQTYCFIKTTRSEQCLLLVTALCAVGYGLYGQMILFFAAVVLTTGFLANQWRKKTVIKKTPGNSDLQNSFQTP